MVRKPGSALTEAELLEWLVPNMPYFMVPRYIDFVTDLPQTPTMKIKKAELRERGISASTWDREAAGISVKKTAGGRT